MYGRFEGFEHGIESIFGPKGPASSTKIQDKIPKVRLERDAMKNKEFKSKVNGFTSAVDNNFDKPKVCHLFSLIELYIT